MNKPPVFEMALPLDYRRASDVCYGNRVASHARRDRHQYPRSICATPGSSESLDPGIPVITVSDSQLLESVRRSKDPVFQTFSKLAVPRSRSEVRKSGAHLSSSSSAASRESSPECSFRKGNKRSASPGSRSIRVEYPDSRRSSSQSLGGDLDESVDECDTPHHNLSSSLTMTSLQNGQFAAELSLKNLPMDDLVLYASGHMLEIVVDKNANSQDKTHTIAVPYHYGVVDLPIFLDAASLVFAKDSERNVLLLEGQNKGCVGWKRGCSSQYPQGHKNHSKPNVVSMLSRLLTKLKLKKANNRGIFVKEVTADPEIQ